MKTTIMGDSGFVRQLSGVELSRKVRDCVEDAARGTTCLIPRRDYL